MKKALLFLLSIGPFLSIAQIQQTVLPEAHPVGQMKVSGWVAVKLYYYIDNGDTTYHLNYKNAEYTRISDYQTIKFSEEGGTLDTLYSFLVKAFEAEKDSKIGAKLGDTDIVIKTSKFLGNKQVDFFVASKGYFTLNSKAQLARLFGKK